MPVPQNFDISGVTILPPLIDKHTKVLCDYGEKGKCLTYLGKRLSMVSWYTLFVEYDYKLWLQMLSVFIETRFKPNLNSKSFNGISATFTIPANQIKTALRDYQGNDVTARVVFRLYYTMINGKQTIVTVVDRLYGSRCVCPHILETVYNHFKRKDIGIRKGFLSPKNEITLH